MEGLHATPEVGKSPRSGIERLGEIAITTGFYDASVDKYPNPPEAVQKWAENPCIIPGED